MSRTQVLSFLFFAFAIAAYSVLEWHHTKKEDIEVVENNITPDFIAESLKSEAFSLLGSLTYRIDARRMEHYNELAVTYFEYPKYTLYPKDSDVPWKISANEGTLYNSNRVKLENNVLLISTDEKSLIREIHGKYLELDLNTNIISSENRIEIKGVDFAMQGTGLIIDLNTKQVTLTQHEQTIYQPSAH
ncbi:MULTISPECIES: LPS export ABC transporter periplasmic protein LptC [Thalassotalea]|uniref:LPS export ABC transporter periplasmic protein LptC n=1 Tax=Thalassotalea TaxID=1518149 RepID=UPI000944996C|nr:MULTISPECIES: LPS export ABC transporter periplasmic protein LptC [Thalassotalea]OKY26129.1 LPS export ABC transporter periplasmic protein LptC [Thalassotalea sp. PP2-459]